MNWLFKEEPTDYSYDALVKDGKTQWSGVKNPLAQKHLRSVKKGDRIFYYHTGDEKAVVGIAKAVSNAYQDPADRSGKHFVVDVAPEKKLPRPVTLAEVKANKLFVSFPLVRIPRLSVMPVGDREWAEIEKMAKSKARPACTNTASRISSDCRRSDGRRRVSSREQEPAWESGWDAHEQAQRRRLARLPLDEKLRWLEDAHDLVRHLSRHGSGENRHAETLDKK